MNQDEINYKLTNGRFFENVVKNNMNEWLKLRPRLNIQNPIIDERL